VFRGSTMQVVRRIRPHALRSATAPGNLPISDAPALPLPRATPLGSARLRRCRGHGAESGGARRISTIAKGAIFKREVPQRLDLPGKPDPASDQVTSSEKRLISAIGAGIPRHLCARQAPASPWLCGNDNHSSSTQCGCVAVCPIGDIVPVVTAKAGSRAFLLSRIGHPAYIRTSALRVLSNARAP